MRRGQNRQVTLAFFQDTMLMGNASEYINFAHAQNASGYQALHPVEVLITFQCDARAALCRRGQQTINN